MWTCGGLSGSYVNVTKATLLRLAPVINTVVFIVYLANLIYNARVCSNKFAKVFYNFSFEHDKGTYHKNEIIFIIVYLVVRYVVLYHLILYNNILYDAILYSIV